MRYLKLKSLFCFFLILLILFHIWNVKKENDVESSEPITLIEFQTPNIINNQIEEVSSNSIVFSNFNGKDTERLYDIERNCINWVLKDVGLAENRFEKGEVFDYLKIVFLNFSHNNNIMNRITIETWMPQQGILEDSISDNSDFFQYHNKSFIIILIIIIISFSLFYILYIRKRKYHKKEVDEIFEKMANLYKKADNYKIKYDNNLYELAYSIFNKKKYIIAKVKANDAEIYITKIITEYESATKLIDESINLLNKTPFKDNENINNAMLNKEHGNYKLAIEFGKKAKSEIQLDVEIHSDTLMKFVNVKGEINKAKTRGIIFSEENYQKSIESINKKDYKKANYHLEKAKSEIQESIEMHEKAIEVKKEIEKIVKYAYENEILFHEEKYYQGLDSFNAGYYGSAEIYFNEAISELNEIISLYHLATNAFNFLSNTLNEAKKMGIIFSENDYQNAKVALTFGDYKKAKNLVEKVNKKTQDKLNLYNSANLEIQKMKDVIKKAKELKIIISEEKFQHVNVTFQNGDYTDTINCANVLRKEIEYNINLKEELLEKIPYTENLYNEAIEFIIIKDLEPNFNELKSMFKNNEFEKSVLFTKNLIDLIEKTKLESEPIINITIPEEIKSGIWNRVELKINNSGDAHVKDIEISISGKIENDNIPIIPVVKAGESESVEFGIFSKYPGDISMDFEITYFRIFNNKRYDKKERKWLKAT